MTLRLLANLGRRARFRSGRAALVVRNPIIRRKAALPGHRLRAGLLPRMERNTGTEKSLVSSIKNHERKLKES